MIKSHAKGMSKVVAADIRQSFKRSFEAKPVKVSEEDAFRQMEQMQMLAQAQANLKWDDGRQDRIRFLREQVESIVRYGHQDFIRGKALRRIGDLADSHTAYEFLDKNIRYACVDRQTYLHVVERLIGEPLRRIPANIGR